MTLGTSRPRNWGKESQVAALAIATERNGVSFQLRKGLLYLAASKNGVTLPFKTAVAELVHIRRGRWHAVSLWDDHVIATGISERDVIRATIQAVWQ